MFHPKFISLPVGRNKIWCEIQNVAEALGLDRESHHGFKEKI